MRRPRAWSTPGSPGRPVACETPVSGLSRRDATLPRTHLITARDGSVRPTPSSAHLRLAAAFSGWKDPGAAFTAITRLGAEAAVLIYFRRDVGRILSAWFRSLTNKEMRRDHDAQMGWLVIVGSIPIGVLGVTLKDQIEGPFRDLRITATMLIVMGVVIGVADRLAAGDETGGRHRAPKLRKTLEHLNAKDGLLYGLCQAMTRAPGVSRSGATTSGGLFLGCTREAAE